MTNKAYLIIGLLFSLYGCLIVDFEAQLQSNLITRKEAVEKIKNASILKIALCLEKNEFSDVLNFTDYTDYLICNGSCNNSNYYRIEDVNYLYNSILFLSCDFDSKFLVPKINPFKVEDVQFKYISF